MRFVLPVIAGLLLSASAIRAQEASRQVVALAFMTGTCDRLSQDSKALAVCKGVLPNFRYSDGRENFTFVQEDHDSQFAVAFSGNRHGETVRADGATVRPIDMVVIGSADEMTGIDATGECFFTDPAKGKAVISCTAQTERGLFSGQFTTDGKAPDVTEMPQP